MIQNNPTNVSAAVEMLLEEVEAEIEFFNGLAKKAFEERDFERVREAIAHAEEITGFRNTVAELQGQWKALAAKVQVGEEPEQAPPLPRNVMDVALIYAPNVNQRTFLHFSWKNESCALRDYSLSDVREPIPDRTHSKSGVARLVEKEVEVPRKGRGNIHQVAFWHELILRMNREHGLG